MNFIWFMFAFNNTASALKGVKTNIVQHGVHKDF